MREGDSIGHFRAWAKAGLRGSVALLLAGAGGGLAAQTTLSGAVTDAATGKPIPRAVVSIPKVDKRAVADDAGKYSIRPLWAGKYLIEVRALGYQPYEFAVEVPDRGSVKGDFSLPALSTRLDPVEVTGRVNRPQSYGLEAFDERRRLGFGVFIDSAELRRSEYVALGDLLARNRGVYMERSRTGAFAMSPVKTGITGGRCPMSIMLDGQLVYGTTGTPIRGPLPRGLVPLPPIPPPDMNAFISVADLDAIEIYRSPGEIPSMFGARRTECGMIVLWSRRGPPRGGDAPDA